MTFAPNTIGPGSVATTTFIIENIYDKTDRPNPVNVIDLAFNNTFPVGVTIADPANASTNCSNATLSVLDSSNISFTGGQLSANATCNVTVDVTSSSLGTYMNVSGDLTSSAGNSGSATDDLTVAADRPGFSKLFDPSSVPIGTKSTLTFTIDNSDAASVNLYRLNFTDILPSGMVIASPANANTDCGEGTAQSTLTAVSGSSTITLSVIGVVLPAGNEALPAGGKCTVSVDVLATGVGNLDNISGELTSSSNTSSFSSGKASATLTSTVTPLAIIKSFTDDPVPAGGTVNLEFTITNYDRNFTATGISFTDDLDAALSGLAAEGLPASDVCGAGSTLSGTSVLTLSGGTLAPGASCSFSVTLQVPGGTAPGSYLNTTSAIIGDVGGTPVTGNVASDILFVEPVPLLTKTFLDNPVSAGGTTELEFTITNTSNTSSATDITFYDEFYEGLPTATGIPATGFCGAGSTASFTPRVDPPPPSSTIPARLTVNGASLPPGGTCTFSITLDVNTDVTTGNYLNTTSEISAFVDGATRTGLPASDTLTIAAAPRLVKNFIDDPVTPGGTVTLEFELTHSANASTNATSITFTDDLNAALPGLTAVGLPISNVCGAGSQISGTSNLTLSGGILTPGESCTISLTLNVPAGTSSGSYSNTTSDVSASVNGIAVTSPASTDTLEVYEIFFSKAFIGDPVIPGDKASLQFTIENRHATDNADITSFTDNLAANLPGLAAEGSPTVNTCGGTLSGTTFLTYTGGTVLAGQTCTISVDVRVPSGSASGVYRNTTGSLFVVQNGALTIPPATDTLEVNKTFLQLTKAFTDDPVNPGDPMTLEFVLTNLDANRSASAIDFTDNLNAALTGLTFGSVLANDCGATISGETTTLITVTGASLGAGASCTISVSLSVPGGALAGLYTNTTSNIIGEIAGLAVEGSAASDKFSVVTYAASFSKSFSGPATATGSVTLTFDLANLDNTAALSELEFNDNLDDVITGLTASNLPLNDVCGTGSVVELSGSLITFKGGSLAAAGSAGDSCSFDVDLSIPASATAGTYPNTTNSLTTNGQYVTAPATADLTIEPPPTFAKVFTPDTGLVGSVSTLTFTIDNSASAVAANGLDFTDNLPAGVVVASPANTVNGCGGTVTAAPGTGTISLTGGTVTASGTCTIKVDVSTTTYGNFNNTTGDLTSSSGNSGTASDTLTANENPAVFSKAFSPATINEGGTSTLTFTIDNTGKLITAASLDFSDTLPANLSIAATSNAGTTCSGGTITAVSGTSVISYTGGSVAADSSCTVNVDVYSTIPGDYNNLSGDLTSSTGNSGTANAILKVIYVKPGFSKAFLPDTVRAGEISTLTFTIDNTAGFNTLTALDFSDNLPAGVSVANPANASTNCLGGTLTANSGSTSITYTGGAVPAASSCSVSVDVVANTDGDLVNTSGDLTSVAGNSGPASATLSVSYDSATFSKAFSPASTRAGAATTLIFTIDNTGSLVDATGLAFSDNLPSGVIVATPANASTSCTGGTLTAVAGSASISYSGGTVTANSSCEVRVSVTANASGDYLNNSSDLSASTGTVAAASASLNVVVYTPNFSKAFAPTNIVAGGISTLTFTIGNPANLIDATGLGFTDNLPAGMIVANPANASTTCSGGTISAVPGSQTISYSGGTVVFGSTCNVQVDVTTTSGGMLSNTSGDLTSSLGNSGTATAVLFVSTVAPGFSKAFAPATINAGAPSTLTFTIDNTGSLVDATDLAFTDSLRSNLIVATPANASTTCSGGTLTAVAGSQTISYSGGTVAAGGTCTVQVDITSMWDGSYYNSSQLASSLGNSGSAIDTLNVNYVPIASFSKAFVPDSINAGDISTLTFTIDNSDSLVDANNLEFLDYLPVHVNLAEPYNPRTSCIGGSFSESADHRPFWYTGGTVPAGAVCTVEVDVTSDRPGTYTNTSEELKASTGNVPAASADLTVTSRNSVSGMTATGSGMATVEILGGDDCNFLDYSWVKASEVSPGASDRRFVHGMFQFRAGPGCWDSIDFKYTFPAELGPGTKFWKYGPTRDNPTPHWYQMPATIEGNVITVTFTDGGDGDGGDLNIAQDGYIIDPGGPASVGVTGGARPIPVMGMPAMLLLMLMLSMVAGGVLAKRRFS